MEATEIRLIGLVNLLADAFYTNLDDPGPPGPWGPWIREALVKDAFPQPWRPGVPDPWSWRIAGLAAYDWRDDRPWPPYWNMGALLRDLPSINPRPPVDSGIGSARSLSTIAMRRAQEANGEQGGNILLRFCDD